MAKQTLDVALCPSSRPFIIPLGSHWMPNLTNKLAIATAVELPARRGCGRDG